MEFDEAWLKKLVEKRAAEMWREHARPYYISFIATDAHKAGADYREIIAPLRLRQWATTAKIPGAKVLVHPVHKAKVGFIPDDQEYHFEDESGVAVRDEAPSEAKPRPKSVSGSRRALLYFLQSLNRLSDEDLDQIQIPTKVIVRLLND